MITKLAFGLGSTAEWVAIAGVGGYAMFYYNQILGLPATLAGLAMTVSIVFDGLVDPFIGSISDRTRSRFGRRHPFMFAAPVPIALCLLAIFNPPAQLQGLWLFGWFLAFVVSLRIVTSLFHVPQLAMGAELSSDYTERTRVMAYSSVMGAVGSTGTSFIALTFFFHATPDYPRGLMNPAAYPPFAWAIAGASLVLLVVCALATARQIPQLPRPPADLPAFRPVDFFRDMASAFANRNYLFLLIAVFFFSLMFGLRSGMHLYLNTFFWELTSEQLRWFAFTTLAGFFVSFYAAARLHGRFDKRRTMIVSCILVSIIPAIPITLRLAGLFPGAESPSLVPLLMGFGIAGGAMAGLLGISVMSALADIADENELRFGLRQEGVLYSTRSVFSKIDTAVGTFMAGVALDIAGLPEKAVPGEVAEHVVRTIAVIEGPVAVLPGLIAAAFYARYAIDQASNAETRAQLAARRAGG